MGLFDLFASKEDRARGALEKLRQNLLQKYGPPENRAKAIEQLADDGSADALATLCMRFTLSVDQSITDADEKEHVLKVLLDEGEPAVEPLKQFVHQQE
ncbi:MAG TPA: HEAT repeat domain-containing protein, partial [Anaeromyxobacteraceae bacterium]|nr:HEAT repeat domain-containing protein [Anaeromyxobacteraceae bacterium]